MFDQFHLETIPANGISLRVAIQGDGPLIVLVHGWPELWYSWRHQIKPLADLGFRVVAPDVRGYGGSDKPHAVQAYDMATMMADVTGIIDHFGQDKAILIGHDWGAPIVWNTAALRPDRVAVVAGLSVPYRRRPPMPPTDLYRKIYADKFFYQLYFQDEGVAEAELEADVQTALRKIYFAISGDGTPKETWLNRPAGGAFLDNLIDPDPFPAWLTPQDLAYFVDAFREGGFRGPLNRYRNQDRDYAMLQDMGVAPVAQPSCFIAGTDDVVRNFVPGLDLYANTDAVCTDMRVKRLIPGIGHWVQQEAPQAVNDALTAFLRTL